MLNIRFWHKLNAFSSFAAFSVVKCSRVFVKPKIYFTIYTATYVTDRRFHVDFSSLASCILCCINMINENTCSMKLENRSIVSSQRSMSEPSILESKSSFRLTLSHFTHTSCEMNAYFKSQYKTKKLNTHKNNAMRNNT